MIRSVVKLENVALITVLLPLQVSANDPDCGRNAVVNFTLGRTPGFNSLSRFFRINSKTGELCVAQRLDREVRSTYEIPIIATDRGKHVKIVIEVSFN